MLFWLAIHREIINITEYQGIWIWILTVQILALMTMAVLQTYELWINGIELVFTPSITTEGDTEHWHWGEPLARNDGWVFQIRNHIFKIWASLPTSFSPRMVEAVWWFPQVWPLLPEGPRRVPALPLPGSVLGSLSQFLADFAGVMSSAPNEDMVFYSKKNTLDCIIPRKTILKWMGCCFWQSP